MQLERDRESRHSGRDGSHLPAWVRDMRRAPSIMATTAVMAVQTSSTGVWCCIQGTRVSRPSPAAWRPTAERRDRGSGWLTAEWRHPWQSQSMSMRASKSTPAEHRRIMAVTLWSMLRPPWDRSPRSKIGTIWNPVMWMRRQAAWMAKDPDSRGAFREAPAVVRSPRHMSEGVVGTPSDPASTRTRSCWRSSAMSSSKSLSSLSWVEISSSSSS
mmetsp:Transcript_19278/g.56094  ORF Transcript_19278/g.56094 Transcript_19278/m.56094 type:complete len:214 (-) Transcript_19278:597-1238(-)